MTGYFSGHGRVDRLGYLMALLAAGLLFCAPAALAVWTRQDAGLRALESGLLEAAAVSAGTAAWGLALWIYCAATARRLHDMDRSGWLAVLALIPAVGLGALTVVLLASRGTDGPNRHGERWL